MTKDHESSFSESDGRTKLLRNDDQQEFVIERIKEQCVENFGKK
jgi:hypothetical protein